MTPTVTGAIEEAFQDKLSPESFRQFLIECLTASVYTSRGADLESAEALADSALINKYVSLYTLGVINGDQS